MTDPCDEWPNDGLDHPFVSVRSVVFAGLPLMVVNNGYGDFGYLCAGNTQGIPKMLIRQIEAFDAPCTGEPA